MTEETMRKHMVEMRRAFHLYCGFDIGLHKNPEAFCYALRSQGKAISGANSWSQGEKWRLNPEPDWSDLRSLDEQYAALREEEMKEEMANRVAAAGSRK